MVTIDDDLVSVCDSECSYEYRDRSPVVKDMDIQGS